MQAFPIVQPPGALIIENGATLRDYFAAQCDVMPYKPYETLSAQLNRAPTIGELTDYISAIRYTAADSMLLARQP